MRKSFAWRYHGAPQAIVWCSIVIQLRRKFDCALIQVVVQRSLRNFAKGTTAGKFGSDVDPYKGVIVNSISIEFEMWWNNQSWSDPLARLVDAFLITDDNVVNQLILKLLQTGFCYLMLMSLSCINNALVTSGLQRQVAGGESLLLIYYYILIVSYEDVIVFQRSNNILVWPPRWDFM